MTAPDTAPCPGPVVWFPSPGPDGARHGAAILECRCGYIVVTPALHDKAHAYTPLLREGLAA